MRQLCLGFAVTITMLASTGLAQAPAAGPYKVLKTAKVGGSGAYDYVFADSDGRRLYIARTGPMSRMTVYNLDTLEPAGEIATTNSHGAAVDPKSNHGIISSKPLLFFDSKTMMPIKMIEVQGNPDGMLYDPSDQRTYVLSHAEPHVTAINMKDGAVIGTVNIGGEPEQAVSDGKGHLYIDVEDKDNVAVVDAKTLKVTAHYDVTGKGGTCAGLSMDVKNRILFASCRNPANMVILNADTGKIITTLPIGMNSDGGLFNPKTMEAFSSNVDGTLNIIKENSPTSFTMEQTLQTMPGARTSALDTKTGHILLIGAEFGPPTPPKEPGGRAGRGQIIPDSFTILMVGK
jgi:DNA-binding beta-propeller fold protein YncE